MIDKTTVNKVKELEDMAVWLCDEVMDEENWELNAVANGEVICRKLVKCGLLERKDGYYRYAKQYYRPTISIIAENRRERYKKGTEDAKKELAELKE